MLSQNVNEMQQIYEIQNHSKCARVFFLEHFSTKAVP